MSFLLLLKVVLFYQKPLKHSEDNSEKARLINCFYNFTNLIKKKMFDTSSDMKMRVNMNDMLNSVLVENSLQERRIVLLGSD